MPTPAPDTLMDHACDLAEEAVFCGEAPIACLLYDADGHVVARGWNQRRSTGDITRHAEMVALAASAQPGYPTPGGLTLVSTLEPCVMCWGACLELKVSHVVFGLEAPPNGGSTRVHDPGRTLKVTGPVRRGRARGLFVDWVKNHPDHAGAGFVRDLLHATADR